VVIRRGLLGVKVVKVVERDVDGVDVLPRGTERRWMRDLLIPETLKVGDVVPRWKERRREGRIDFKF
jgi:hypothetical protein